MHMQSQCSKPLLQRKRQQQLHVGQPAAAAAADLLPAKLGSIMYASTSSSGSLRRLQALDRQGRAGREAGGGRRRLAAHTVPAGGAAR